MKLFLIDDGVPEETLGLLGQAAEDRGIETLVIQAAGFDFRPERRLEAGDLLFRPATSLRAIRVEQFLYRPGVGTLYSGPEDIYFDPTSPILRMQAAGVPTPRCFYATNAERGLLDDFAERLGGYPIVVKAGGGSLGVGTLIAESAAALYSLVDYLVAQGISPLLCAYVADALHWRLIVVAEAVVASYTSPIPAGDFRTGASEDADDHARVPSAALCEAALKAVHCQHTRFGGVDLLEHSSGRVYVLEANFPCYFPQAQLVGGADVAGAMIEALRLSSARR